MVLPRPTVLRSAAQQLARPAGRGSFRSAGRQQPWQRINQSVTRRGYASSHGGSGQSHAKSDLPWLVGSLAVGVPGTWWMLQPGDAHHGGHDEHHEKHEEAKEEVPKEEPKEQPKEEPEAEAKEEPKEESKDDSEEEPKKEEIGPKEGSDSSPRFKGATSAGGEDKAAPDNRYSKTDAKEGANKRRIDSTYGTPLGAHESENDKPGSAKDQPSPSKEPLSQNQTSGKQQGISNTDTKHSIDVDNKPTESKKPEGSVDSAKTKGPVDPNRPAAPEGDKDTSKE
ncbi:hypothetical protein MPH_13057 [Macrophomina phaseolina MS6]|uniref:Uncharacterized protein n=2 Tax=Macrophomina phaseolina TaxID=35725 RepID=K2RZE8_MACPH|nr:hypothetical protein MPH_13057 [Macrophomina phaseolina MS6]KAH7007811.1 hypothetical protein B0J12DRAFT_692252 [Macrophomina phaseolina]